MLATLDGQKKPPVRVTESDYERLLNLSRSSETGGAVLLARELERACVVQEAQMESEPPFARLGGFVEYQDLLTGRVRQVQLTAPDAADIDAGRLSVLTPVGAALLGLSAGDSFSWTGEDGRPRVVVVQGVSGALRGAAKRRAV